jgi:TM2 domain-containing membrane protein YozV
VKNKVLFFGQIHARHIHKERLLLCLLLWLGVFMPGTLLAQTPDTTRQRPIIRPGVPAPDTLTPEMATENAALLVDSLLVDEGDSVAVDTVQLSEKATAEIRKIIPKRAALLSLAMPGLGQIYNGQKWKAPIIYAGFGALGYFIVTYTGNYQEYLTGYRTASAMTVDPVTQLPITDPRDKVAIVNGRELDLNQLKQGTDFWRRWRDYNIIFTALFWGLNVVDANVTAHLKTFDLSDSLTMKYAPTVIPSPTGFAPGIKLTMTFKK